MVEGSNATQKRGKSEENFTASFASFSVYLLPYSAASVFLPTCSGRLILFFEAHSHTLFSQLMDRSTSNVYSDCIAALAVSTFNYH